MVQSTSVPDEERDAATRLRRDRAGFWYGTRILTLLFLLTTVLFVALAVAAYRAPYFPVDLTVTRALQSFDSPAADRAAELVNWPGFPPQSNVFFGGIILAMLAFRRVLAAVCQAIAAGGGAALWFWIAPLIGRPRPSPDLVEVSMYIPAGSFPSGHVLNFTAGLGFTWFVAYTLLPKSILRTVVLWLIPLYLVLVGIARVYSGQHWPSDVLGGYLLGAIWLWLVLGLYRRAPQGARACRAWVRGRTSGSRRGKVVQARP